MVTEGNNPDIAESRGLQGECGRRETKTQNESRPEEEGRKKESKDQESPLHQGRARNTFRHRAETM